MRAPGDRGRYLDATVAAFLVAVALFATPLVNLWARSGTPWYVPYLVWLAVIGLAWLVHLLRDRS